MRNVTPLFLRALTSSHKLATKCTYTVPGGQPVRVKLKAGTVTVDAAQRVRRQGSLTVLGTQVDYDAITTPGTVLDIAHGIDYGASQSELVPVFHGEVQQGAQVMGDGTINLGTIADHGTWLSRPFLTPYTPAPNLPRVQAIAAIVSQIRPSATIVTTATDAGLVGVQSAFTGNPQDAITAFCKDGNMDAAFQPDGSFLIQDLPNLSSPPVWIIRGLIESGTRQRPLDKLYNTVIVRPTATDGSQTWTQQVAQITDTTNPRHPNYIGVVPYFVDSPTILTAAAALRTAQNMLYRVLGNTETLQLGLISNPALDANDVIRAIAPRVNSDPANIYQHFVDSFTLDLISGSMSLNTRSQAVSIT